MNIIQAIIRICAFALSHLGILPRGLRMAAREVNHRVRLDWRTGEAWATDRTTGDRVNWSDWCPAVISGDASCGRQWRALGWETHEADFPVVWRRWPAVALAGLGS